jgi:tetratricopeptide (TPR) repeat protein
MHEPTLLLMAHTALGVTLLYLGELTPARANLEQGIALSAEGPRRYDSRRGMLDPGANCLSQVALALWMLGYPDQAIKRSHAALTIATELSHYFSLALALLLVARLYRLRGEERAAQEQAEALIALSAEQGFPDYLAWELSSAVGR